jgi:N-acetylmuramoyl-L-alanine amidase
MIIELGSALASYRVPDSDDSRLTIELLAAGAPAPPAPAPLPTRPQGQAPDVPAVDVNPPGSLRTIVIDPGHGGEDVGVRGQGGATEKDYVLRLARRLKATIEGRFGLRVLLTRDGDDNVPLDRRTSLANNNKADLFISLHANASVSPEARGAQVLSLNLDDYRGRSDAAVASDLPVPVIGGGSRSIDLVPWDVAQLPFAARSAVLSSILARQLSERGVPLYRRPLARLPLRTLVGANMPAVLLEVGFLSTRADETALARDDRSGATIEAVVATIAEVRLGVPAATSRGAAR